MRCCDWLDIFFTITSRVLFTRAKQCIVQPCYVRFCVSRDFLGYSVGYRWINFYILIQTSTNMPTYLSFFDIWLNSFFFNNYIQIWVYYMFYFASLIILSLTKILSSGLKNEFSYWHLFSFIFLIGLPPMPMFFIKLSILFYFFKNLYFIYFMIFLIIFLILWVASFIFIVNYYSTLKLEKSVPTKDFIFILFLVYLLFLGFFFIENILAFFCFL